MFKKILVPVDPAETDFAAPALILASDFGARYGAQVRLVAVLSMMPGLVSEYLPPDYEERAVGDTASRLEAMLATINVPAEHRSHHVRVGGVEHEVVDEARKWEADLIVMTSHKPAMSTYLLGSNAAHIVRHAPCSVMVLRNAPLDASE